MTISTIQTIKIVATSFFIALLAACNGEPEAAVGPVSMSASSTETSSLIVYKSPECGCCQGWIDHANQHGFSTETIHPDDLYAVKTRLDIAPNMRSCHTAVTQHGLVFEGHVPVKFINQFIANTPANAIGLSVPGMVVGSPGMEVDDKFRDYQIIQLNRDGSTSVYAMINSYQQQF
jgi:hypothetical protein